MSQPVGYELLINIRSSANNRLMVIQDPAMRDDIRQILRSFSGNVQWQ
jgi:hypothetical protein